MAISKNVFTVAGVFLVGVIAIGAIGKISNSFYTAELNLKCQEFKLSHENCNDAVVAHYAKLKELKDKTKKARDEKLAAMSPDERELFLKEEIEKKKKAEEIRVEMQRRREVEEKHRKEVEKLWNEKVFYGNVLQRSILNAAFDPYSAVLKDPVYVKNGVCIEANLKNRFGAYVGYKNFCALKDKKGKWNFHE